jgi:hypothetical protein
VDPTALRLERIRLGQEATQRVVELWARLSIAVLAVALTLAGTLAVGVVVGQVAPLAALFGALALGCVGAKQLIDLRRGARLLREVGETGVRAIDRLIAEEVERSHDEQGSDS